MYWELLQNWEIVKSPQHMCTYKCIPVIDTIFITYIMMIYEWMSKGRQFYLNQLFYTASLWAIFTELTFGIGKTYCLPNETKSVLSADQELRHKLHLCLEIISYCRTSVLWKGSDSSGGKMWYYSYFHKKKYFVPCRSSAVHVSRLGSLHYSWIYHKKLNKYTQTHISDS